MFTHISSASRGYANHGWLESRFSFSFADYYDPKKLGFHHLRVINEDLVQAGMGFGMHPHRDMEILTYIISGALEHKDSMGNGSVIVPGRVQAMSAGTGVMHSEFNPLPDETTHLLQIWMFPEARNLKPMYQEADFPLESKLNRLCLIASHDGRDGSVVIHQTIDLYASILEPGHPLDLPITPDRHCWVQLISGELSVNGNRLQPGDALAIKDETALQFTSQAERSEFLVWEMK
jgi:redox-sensitive bicupin YhaK (pirin superfamily)